MFLLSVWPTVILAVIPGSIWLFSLSKNPPMTKTYIRFVFNWLIFSLKFRQINVLSVRGVTQWSGWRTFTRATGGAQVDVGSTPVRVPFLMNWSLWSITPPIASVKSMTIIPKIIVDKCGALISQLINPRAKLNKRTYESAAGIMSSINIAHRCFIM